MPTVARCPSLTQQSRLLPQNRVAQLKSQKRQASQCMIPTNTRGELDIRIPPHSIQRQQSFPLRET